MFPSFRNILKFLQLRDNSICKEFMNPNSSNEKNINDKEFFRISRETGTYVQRLCVHIRIVSERRRICEIISKILKLQYGLKRSSCDNV